MLYDVSALWITNLTSLFISLQDLLLYHENLCSSTDLTRMCVCTCMCVCMCVCVCVCVCMCGQDYQAGEMVCKSEPIAFSLDHKACHYTQCFRRVEHIRAHTLSSRNAHEHILSNTPSHTYQQTLSLSPFPPSLSLSLSLSLTHTHSHIDTHTHTATLCKRDTHLYIHSSLNRLHGAKGVCVRERVCVFVGWFEPHNTALSAKVCSRFCQ